MTRVSSQLAWMRAIAAITLSLGAFGLLIEAVRHVEAVLCVRLLGLLGIDQLVVVGPGAVMVLPDSASHGVFVATVTRGCSSLGSILAGLVMVCLVLVGPTSRRVRAALLVVAVVFVANVLRISLALAVGVWLGDVALVLFHNWVAALFAFFYVLFALVAALSIMLPGDRAATPVEATT